MEEETRSNQAGGRVPPQDIVAEKSLLGAVMISDAVLPEVLTILKPRDFYEKRHELIFQAMLDLYDQHKPIDLLTLTAELKAKKQLKEVGGAPYLTELSNFVPASAHAKAYAEIIERASVRRRLIRAGAEITNKAYEDDANVDILIGAAEKELFEVSDKIIKSDYVAMDELLADAFDRIEELHKNKGALRGLKTGFRDLDKKTAGFQKGDLIIIGARPAMGKTTFAQNLAYNIASINKKGVLFFSMEMAANEIIDRMISDVSGVDNWKMRTGNLSDEEFAKTLPQAPIPMPTVLYFIPTTTARTGASSSFLSAAAVMK
ncbi:replicative DNA helicase [Candidatus Saccharibacteria bacterium]|nr:replicative DNA helicase [Candidatus Saccharibacteria bacterium]